MSDAKWTLLILIIIVVMVGAALGDLGAETTLP